MANRVFVFSNEAIIKRITDHFVPVTGDDWYQRRRQDTEGDFFRSVADQGPRKGEGGSTRQGVYAFTASGELLGYRNTHSPEHFMAFLNESLERWAKLPESERAPGAVKVPPREAVRMDDRFIRTPPEGGLIVKVWTRVLQNGSEGELEICTADGSAKRGLDAARDHLWLTADDWRSLVPAQVTVGHSMAVPERIAYRIMRFHLVDSTRGEPPMWRTQDVRRHAMTLTVQDATDSTLTLRLDGQVLLATHADPAKADRGYEANLLGYLTYDRKTDRFTEIRAVAIGDHWGEGPFTGGARPGRSPLGVSFELVSGEAEADRVPPQAGRDRGGYFEGK